jgi:hypothetical protein
MSRAPDSLDEAMAAILGYRPCAHCGRLLPRLPADDQDPMVRALGRICDPCYQRQEETR